ncbi:hypothetical protein NUW58_g109 [Xylaria curta]|uniref:Uncharacterized protein n=1 Tax=Xylaria curta TaxID=42375 RepID=A0ACC1PQY1_9PEZI|nr:hypothetical protein NUW58_g109 [Xylaria curta]
MLSVSASTGSYVADSNNATLVMRPTIINIAREHRQLQANIDTSHLSPTDTLIIVADGLADQTCVYPNGFSQPHPLKSVPNRMVIDSVFSSAIGEVEAGYANKQYNQYHSDAGGYAPPTAATQGSAKVKRPTPTTTIVPFGSLPSCAAKCGPLYDANGACVPPVNPSTDENTWKSCFCAFGTLQPLKSGPNDVCSGNCNTEPQGLSSIQSWFTSFCNEAAASTTATSGRASSTAGSGNSGKNQGGGDWASTHVNWIVFIVVVVVAIIGIWTGACIWRRKYLKKKDRLYELGKGLPSTVAVNTQGNLVGSNVRDSTISNGPGLFMSGPGVVEQPERPRNKWGRRS